MPRIRTIKPQFFTSRTVAGLSLQARLTFIGLWTMADDKGRLEYDPRLVKAALWALDDDVTAADVATAIRELTESSVITHYTHGDGARRREYLTITGWDEHQKINRPTPSTIPAPEQGVSAGQTPFTESSVSPPDDSMNPHGALTVGKEGKGKERNKEVQSSELDEFDRWYSLYPRKEAKENARKAFIKARKSVDFQTLVAGLKNYVEAVKGKDPQFTALPASWLNAGRWEDEPVRQILPATPWDAPPPEPDPDYVPPYTPSGWGSGVPS